MHMFSAIFLGIATNLDNFMIGLSVGLQGKRIPFFSNLAIALSSALAGFLSCYLASLCAELGRWPGYLGGGMLILLGLWPLLKRNQQPQSERVEKERRSFEVRIGPRKTLFLAIALAVNCVPASFGAGMTGAYPAPTAAMIGAGSFIAVGAGGMMGRYTSANVKSAWLERAAAIMMVLLGVLEIFI